MSISPDDPARRAAERLGALSDQERLRRRRQKARRVLFVAFLVILAALALVPIWAWLVPAFIYEGPMVQNTHDRQATLVWYMSRAVGDGLAVRLADGRTVPVECVGSRCRAVLTDLPFGAEVPYRITYGQRTLVSDALRTMRRPDQPYSFVVFGDSGKATQAQFRLADQIIAADPDFVLHTGDLIYGRGERFHYRSRFFTPYASLLRRVNFWPCVGNHDVFMPIQQSPYFEVFELPRNGPAGLTPEHEYWFDYANARVVVLDSERDERTLHDVVAPWVEQVFATGAPRWKFVVFHRPPYTAGQHPPRVAIQRALAPSFERAGVDIVFNGHDHMYERTRPIRGGQVAADGRGVVYIVTGAGGARLYTAFPPEQRPDYIASLHNEVHSFTLVKVAGDTLMLDQIALGGDTLDHWVLHKGTP